MLFIQHLETFLFSTYYNVLTWISTYFGCSTGMHEMTSWPPSWKCDVKSKIQLCQSTHTYLKNIPAEFHRNPIWNPDPYHIIISYHIVHFSGASSKTQAPQPLNKQVSFQQCCKCSRRQCRVTNADWQAVYLYLYEDGHPNKKNKNKMTSDIWHQFLIQKYTNMSKT